MVKKEDLVNKTLHQFSTKQDFETFLDAQHQHTSEIFIKLAKKKSGIPSITLNEAIEVALCFGWIDGSGCTIDDQFWTTRFLPRRPKSIWSQKNKDTAIRLIAESRMRPEGLNAVEGAKSNGQWDKAYASPSIIVEPDDFNLLLNGNEAATTTYASLNKTQRYSVLWRIETASSSVRAKRIHEAIDALANGIKPTRPGTSTKESKGTPEAKPAKVIKKTTRKVPAVQSGSQSQSQSQRKSEKGDNEHHTSRQPRRSGLRART